jgi:glucoamylase
VSAGGVGGVELDEWIAAQARCAARSMLRAISATDLVMDRPGFGQRVVPQPGSILASPVPAHYDPEPDYFFHWFRDSALVIDALRVALAEGYVAGSAAARFGEFVGFSRSLEGLDGQELLRHGDPGTTVQPDFLQYLRPDAEIAALRGAAVSADVRVNPDGTLDVIRWARPQMDGPALRALAVLRWWRQLPEREATLRAAAAELIGADLAFTLSYCRQPGFDIWEELSGCHYYTQRVQAQALDCGAQWLEESGDPARARACRRAAEELLVRLDALWDAAGGFYRAHAAGAPPDKGGQLDIAVILAIVHARRAGGPHSVLDPKAQATLSALEELFEAEYAINHHRPPERGAAMGRYANDRYYSGGAYFFATLGAAEFYFRLAEALRGGATLAATPENQRFRQRLGVVAGAVDGERGPADLAFARGDAIMRTVQAYTPGSGELAEQFDRHTGAPASARHLAWSYAAFITAAATRAQARQAIPGAGPATPAADRA